MYAQSRCSAVPRRSVGRKLDHGRLSRSDFERNKTEGKKREKLFVFTIRFEGHYSHGLNRLDMYVNDIKSGTTARDGLKTICERSTNSRFFASKIFRKSVDFETVAGDRSRRWTKSFGTVRWKILHQSRD